MFNATSIKKFAKSNEKYQSLLKITIEAFPILPSPSPLNKHNRKKKRIGHISKNATDQNQKTSKFNPHPHGS
jgi:hypothetical protein